MKNDRREFIKQVSTAIAGITIVPRQVLGKGFTAPSDRFNLAVIGTGAQGSGLTKRIFKNTTAPDGALGPAKIDFLIGAGLLEDRRDRLVATRSGRLVIDRLVAELLIA